jgi:hypothetical protein
MSTPNPGHERAPLTDRESLIRMDISDPRITHGRCHSRLGERTASSTALGFLLGCTTIAAPGVLPRSHLHVVRHDRGRHDGAIGPLGVTSIIRALNLRPKLYDRCGNTFIARRLSLISSRFCGPGRRCGCSQLRCGSMTGWCWSGMASRSPNAGSRCRASSSCICNPIAAPSPNHNGAFLAGDSPARTRGLELLRRAPCPSNSRGAGVIQS